MGAGGNYAQAAMQTLFGEQLRELQNQAAQPAEVNQELVEQYTPESTPIGETTGDITRRFTEGTGAVPQSKDFQSGLASLEQKIADERDKLSGLTVTETSERMVPQYEMTTPSPTYGLAGGSPPTTKIVSSLPEDTRLTQGQYGPQYYQAPIQSYSSMGQQNMNPTYRRVGSKKVIDTNVRDAIAGDDIYDKQMNLVNQLQRQYDVRSKYSDPSSTGIQGLIAEPIVNQPQTGYNNINEIMKRYIG